MSVTQACGGVAIMTVALFAFDNSNALAAQRSLAFSADMLTEQLKAYFPQRRCLAGIACVTLSEPKVRMKSGSPRLFVETRGQPTLGAQGLPDGVIELGAKPRFDTASGRFFLDAPVLTRFSFPGIAPESVAMVAGVLQPLFTDMLSTTPVWELDDSDPEQALARVLLRDVVVRDGKLYLLIGDDDDEAEDSSSAAEPPKSPR